MKSLKIRLKNCYGIRRLRYTFEFENCNSAVIYAPNGSMKSSFAKTLKDYAKKLETTDQLFHNRKTKRQIVDENEKPITPDSILVFGPIDREYNSSKKASKLLENLDLIKEYRKLANDVDRSKEEFISKLKGTFNLPADVEKEIMSVFGRKSETFQDTIMRISSTIENNNHSRVSGIPYEIFFHPHIEEKMKDPKVINSLNSCIKHLNSLAEKHPSSKRDIYDPDSIDLTAKDYFYDEENALKRVENSPYFKTQKMKIKAINEIKNEIKNDKDFYNKFAEFKDTLPKDDIIEKFLKYIDKDEFILPHLVNIHDLKLEVWKSYFRYEVNAFKKMRFEFGNIESRRREIENLAAYHLSDLEDAIKTFNDRFFVPFELEVQNNESVSLGQDTIPVFGYKFKEIENGEEIFVNISCRDKLMDTLSAGELRAFYILNILFEINVRKKESKETIVVFDDIADSFDYINKYAIIQYLEDIARCDNFKCIILTHNYDFFRAIIRSGGIAQDPKLRLIVEKNTRGIILNSTKLGGNVFVDNWKQNFSRFPERRIASIPFMRNLIEYTKGTKNCVYIKLTSLLHIKDDTEEIMDKHLYDMYETIFESSPMERNPKDISVLQLIIDEANRCLDEQDGNSRLENKIVLSIAIRLVAEKYMIARIGDDTLTGSIDSHQTRELYNIYRDKFDDDRYVMSILTRVLLVTSENIHLNSFMYEPIIDMSDEHLKSIFRELKNLLKSVSSHLDWDIDMRFEDDA